MRALVSGYYGFGNLGDEVILALLVEVLQSRLGSSGDEICVLSAAPADTGRIHEVRAVSRTSLRAIRRELTRCDVFISGGGGLIQDRTSRRSAAYYLGLLSWAKRHVPVVLMGQGLGPLNSGLTQHWAHRILPYAQAALVRDEASARLLRRWGMSSDRLFRGADLTFLRWASDRMDEALCDPIREYLLDTQEQQQHAPYMLVALRGRDVDASITRLSQAIDELAAQRSVRPALVAMHPDEDRGPLERLASQLSSSPPVLDPSGVGTTETLQCFRGAEMVIGSRLHSLIFALLARRPLVALGDDRKVTRLVRDVADMGGPPIPQLSLGGRPARPIKLADAVASLQPWNDRWEGAVYALACRTEEALDGFLDRLASIVDESPT